MTLTVQATIKKILLCLAIGCGAVLSGMPVLAQPKEFSFGVISHSFLKTADDSPLRRAITETDADNLAFVVANGIKSPDEPCTDKLYLQRRDLLDTAKNGLILSLAGSDWVDCEHENGRSAAIDRLNRLREMFFTDEFTLGASKIPVFRQSITPKFRTYNENARWEFGDILFATMNLPAGNNHYLPAAGRNGEFEDRLIANRDWLRRLFLLAKRHKHPAVVIFCDANPLAEGRSLTTKGLASASRDGFTETRKAILRLAESYPGKVLIVHNQSRAESVLPNAITWRRNVGSLDIDAGWSRLTVSHGRADLFTLNKPPAFVKNSRQKE